MRRSKELFAYVSHDSRALVQTLRNRTRPLAKYGIDSFMPMLTSRITISQELQRSIHFAVCAVTSGSRGREGFAGQLPTQRFHFAKFEPWDLTKRTALLFDSATRRLAHLKRHPNIPSDIGIFDSECEDCKPCTFLVACPNCGHVRDCANSWLFRPTQHVAILCTACRHFTSGRRWHCECRRAWITCPLHRASGFACRPVARPRKRPCEPFNAQFKFPARPPMPYAKYRRIGPSNRCLVQN